MRVVVTKPQFVQNASGLEELLSHAGAVDYSEVTQPFAGCALPTYPLEGKVYHYQLNKALIEAFPTKVSLEPEFEELTKELGSLRERITALEEQSIKTIVIREISEAQARAELLEYFQSHPNTYPSDAATELRLDAAVVRDLCQELAEEGRLEE